MSTTASDQAIAISVFAAQDLYYNVTINPAIAIFTYVLICLPVQSQLTDCILHHSTLLLAAMFTHVYRCARHAG